MPFPKGIATRGHTRFYCLLVNSVKNGRQNSRCQPSRWPAARGMLRWAGRQHADMPGCCQALPDLRRPLPYFPAALAEDKLIVA